LTGPGHLAIDDVGPPAGSEREALIRVRSVGICGTDQKLFMGTIPVDYPRILGHEVVGEVIDGAGDPRLRTGSRVLVDPGITCGACQQCLAGRGNICTGGWLLGRDRDGGLREIMSVPARNLHVLPDSVDAATGPLIQVLATCVHGQRLSPILPGTSAVILGLGVTGLLHLQLAKLRGARPIVCVTRSEDKLRAAEALGADATVQAGGPDDPGRILEAIGEGADLVIECVGSVGTLARAVELAAVGGKILAYGTIPATEGSFPFYSLYYKEIVLSSPRSATAEDFPASIDAVAAGRIELGGLVSGRFPLDAARSAIDAGGRPGTLKVLIDL
jgi:2-desacetyl-2-hydroxyethyl bacteriochlorophyllide A dehydrogenase